jgi:hypothetical protein
VVLQTFEKLAAAAGGVTDGLAAWLSIGSGGGMAYKKLPDLTIPDTKKKF